MTTNIERNKRLQNFTPNAEDIQFILKDYEPQIKDFIEQMKIITPPIVNAIRTIQSNIKEFSSAFIQSNIYINIVETSLLLNKVLTFYIMSDDFQNFLRVIKNIESYNKGETFQYLSGLHQIIQNLPMPSQEVDIKVIPDEDVKQINEDVIQCLESSNWQQKLHSKIKRWISLNPIYAIIIGFLLTWIFTQLLDSAKAGIVKEMSNIRVKPKSSAVAISRLSQNQVVKITDEVAYFFKVELPDGTQGWVSKRTVITSASSNSKANYGTE